MVGGGGGAPPPLDFVDRLTLSQAIYGGGGRLCSQHFCLHRQIFRPTKRHSCDIDKMYFQKNNTIRRYNCEINSNADAERVTQVLSMLMHLRSIREFLQPHQLDLSNHS